MTNLHHDNQNNLVSFLRHNKPTPPNAAPDLEQRLFESLELNHQNQNTLSCFHAAKTKSRPNLSKLHAPAKLIATGFLFTSVSFGIKTPRIALEPKDLENFLVKNWQNTFNANNYTAEEDIEAYWLLPAVSEPTPALSVLAQ